MTNWSTARPRQPDGDLIVVLPCRSRYGFGVRFARVMEAVERKQAMDDAIAVAAAKRAAAGETDSSVITVGIVPRKPATAPQH